MSNPTIAPRPERPSQHHQASHMMHSYSNSPLARSTTDLHEGITHEYEPDVDADGFRHPGNHHAELPGEYSPGSSLRPQSATRSGRPSTKSGKRAYSKARPNIGDESKPNSFTFEHEPDVDGDGYRHHHENLSSPALRALQDVVVPLDPRAGRIVITPSPSLKPNYSPYRHIDDIPNRSIEDLQDPEELHSHANMIYGIDEAHASENSVPDWQEGEAATFIEEASHGELHPATVSARHVATKLPIEPTGEVMAPLGNIAGDVRPVGPTRNMSASDEQGIDGAYTKDGEGSAGLPFDGNAGATTVEGDIEIADESSVIAPDMLASTETIKPTQLSSIASDIQQPQKPRAGTPGPVEDIKRPEQQELSQDGSAMVVPEGVKDERPDWLRAAEMMANNEYEKLAEEHLITNERASRESIDFASAARATLMRDQKIDRGTSYPSAAEMERASSTNNVSPIEEDDDGPIERQGVSHLPEKDLGGANPPSGSSARDDKFAVESETAAFKSKDSVEPATASKFLGLSSGAAAGASIPAAALMTGDRDEKSHTAGETKMSDLSSSPQKDSSLEKRSVPALPTHRPKKTMSMDSDHKAEASKSQPAVPRRPQKDEHETTKAIPAVPERPSKTTASTVDKAPPSVPRRPVSSTGAKDTPAVPARPTRAVVGSNDVELKAPKPVVPNRPMPGKLAGSSKFAFASALEAKLKAGPTPAKKPEAETATASNQQVEKTEESTKTLTDARKGRARGPQKRKLPTVAQAEDVQPVSSDSISEALGSPVCEQGEIFISRFGVEMRSMSIQTGVIKISTPDRNMTVMEGAGKAGETVVVDSQPHSKPHVIPPQAEQTFEPATNSSEKPIEDKSTVKTFDNNDSTGVTENNKLSSAKADDLLQVPEVSTADAAGGEIRSLDKNEDLHQTPRRHEHEEESEELTEAKRQALEDELEV